jgi:hypothetical protein
MRIAFSTITKTIELGSESLNRLVTPTGRRKNRPTASRSAKTTVPIQVPRPISSSSPCSPGGSWALAEMLSARKPMLIDSHSAKTPRMTGRRIQRCLRRMDSSGKERTSISPLAPSRGSRRPSSCCSGVGLRTATAHVEIPRIITPSRTAWPPTGASRCAIRAPSGSRVSSAAARVSSVAATAVGAYRCLRLAARRWKRSTRPPVSTSFWRPV